MVRYLLLTVDTEEEWDWSAGWPVHGHAVRNIGRLPHFQDFCARLGLAVTYFTNHAVLDDPAARQIMLELSRRERVEIGMHIHPWNTPPLQDGAPVTARQTFLHNLPAETIHAKLSSLTRLFAAVGLCPQSFRGGRYSTGPVIQDFLRENGFLADASIVPFTTWPDDGAPDYRARDPQPMRRPAPFGANPCLWELPLTRAFTRQPYRFWQRLYRAVEDSPLARLRLIGVAEKVGLVRKLWLNFEQHSADELLRFVQALRETALPYLCFTLHSSTLAGLSPYAQSAADVSSLYERIENVMQQTLQAGFVPATCRDIALHLESEHHARAGHQSA